MPRAFVSSTYEDLKDHRATVIDALHLSGFDVDPMEHWTADPAEPKRFSPTRLKNCDICVLLVALRRGFVPDGSNRSITQLEYDAAIDLGVDVFVCMLREDAPWPRNFDELSTDPAVREWREGLIQSPRSALVRQRSCTSSDRTGARALGQ